VAWWAAIKFPDGTNYAYADVNSPSLAKSAHTMSEATTGALGATVSQIYSANKTAAATDYAFVFYNDQTPAGAESSSRGHTKGVVGLTQAGGFWLVHSVPAYPNNIVNGYPGYTGATTYAQSFLCMNLPFSDFDTVGIQYQYTFPQYYDWNMPSWVPINLLQAVTQSKHTTSAVSNIVKLGSGVFTSMAKTANWAQELYEDLVAPHYTSDLLVETWMNGANPCPTYCRPSYTYDVMNIRSLSVTGVSYTETQDHSKWAVTTTGSTLCIGDIDRQQSQANRAGGTVCFSQSSLYNSLKNAITGADSCPS